MTGWHISLAEIVGYLAAICMLTTFSMKTMVPLRVAGITTNCLFLAYGYLGGLYPVMILHLVLLPLNSIRLYQMLQLIKKVRAASSGDLSMAWLKPFMTRRLCDNGEVVFRKGDVATEMFYTVSGRFRLVDSGIEISAGQVIGELGLIAPENRRSQTFECIEDGELLTINYASVEQLYFQNPTFGFYFLRLASRRLFENIIELQDELARKSTAVTSVP